jgi:hypothetical protein
MAHPYAYSNPWIYSHTYEVVILIIAPNTTIHFYVAIFTFEQKDMLQPSRKQATHSLPCVYTKPP